MIVRSFVLALVSCALLTAQRSGPAPGPRGGGGPSGGGGVADRPTGGFAPGEFNPRGSSGGFIPGPAGPSRALSMPARPGGAPPVTKISYFDGHYHRGRRIIMPPGFPRCTILPDADYWGSRDLMAEIQWLSRAGFLPVTPVDATVESLVDHTWRPAGWKAYGFAIPPGGKLQVEVQHDKLGWFRLMAVDRWGKPGRGMLQAAIAYRPTLVTLTNDSRKAEAVYIIVDDPAWWSDKDSPYTLVIRRDWDPAAVDLTKVQMVAGLWGASPSVSAQFRGPSLTGPAVYPR